MKRKRIAVQRLAGIAAVLLGLFLLFSLIPEQSMAANARFKITKKNVVIQGDTTFTGEAVEPDVMVYGPYYMLFWKDIDYKVRFKNNKKVGTATAVVTGIGQCKGTVKKTFDILPPPTNFRYTEPEKDKITVHWRPLNNQVSGYILTYEPEGNSAKQKKKTISDASADSCEITGLKENTWYRLTLRTFKKVNGKTYRSEEVELFTGTEDEDIESRKDIGNAVVTGLEDVDYDGLMHTPQPTLTYEGETLSDWDYSCQYENNINAGTATVYIQGSGEYEGVTKAQFRIRPVKTNIKMETKKRTIINSPYRKGAQSFLLGISSEEGVKATVQVRSVKPSKGKKYIKVSSSGKVTVDKKAKPGTYQLQLLVKTAKQKNYKATKKKYTCKVTVKKRGKATYPSFASLGIPNIDQATEKRANNVLDAMVKDLYGAGIDFFHLGSLKKAKYVARYIDRHYAYKSAYVNGVLVESRLGTSLALVLQKGYGDCWGFSDTKRCLLRKVGVKKTWCSIAGRLDVGNTNHMRCIVQIGKKYYELNEEHDVNPDGWYESIDGFDGYFFETPKARALYLIGKGPYKKGIENVSRFGM